MQATFFPFKMIIISKINQFKTFHCLAETFWRYISKVSFFDEKMYI